MVGLLGLGLKMVIKNGNKVLYNKYNYNKYNKIIMKVLIVWINGFGLVKKKIII